MHAVQVMNLLQTLIYRTLRERDDAALMEGYSLFSSPMSSQGEGDNEIGEFRRNSMCCCDLEKDASNSQFSFNKSCIYEDDEVAERIEECFLKQLELGGLKGKKDGLEEELICSNTETCIPMSEANEGSSSSRVSNGLVVDVLNLSEMKQSDEAEADHKDMEMVVVESLNLSFVE